MYIKNILILFFLFTAGTIYVSAQQDSCNVQSYVRADGVMIRGVDFEPIYIDDTLKVSAAMYAIDKDYFLVVRIQTDRKIANYTKDLAIQLSDSTVILLSYDSFKSDRSKKTYDGYFKIDSKDLGYIEKYTLVQLKYYIGKDIHTLSVQQKFHILQRHFACLRNT